MQPWPLCKRPRYGLRAVTHHFGGLHNGHYAAMVRHSGSALGGGGGSGGWPGEPGACAQWYVCDDSVVAQCAAPSGGSSSAYVLFFELEQETNVARRM